MLRVVNKKQKKIIYWKVILNKQIKDFFKNEEDLNKIDKND